MKAIIQVGLKQTVLDPQGRAITKVLQDHGHANVRSVRQGKYFEVELESGASRESVQSQLERLAAEVLANPVIEDYDVTVLE